MLKEQLVILEKMHTDISLEEREKLFDELEKMCGQYSNEFNKIKYKFSKKFLKTYYKNKGFHDAEILNFSIKPETKMLKVDMILESDLKKFIITYKNVASVNLNIDFNQCYHPCVDEWLYDEFALLENGMLSHEILLACGKISKIVFKSISIKLIDSEKL